jgi:sarcosine oxidase subunit alpha
MTSTAFRPYKVTAAYRAQRARNAVWTETGQWRIADSFGDAARETSRAREAIGLQDVSPIGKIDLKGAGVGGVLADAGKIEAVTGTLSIKPGHALLLTEPGREAAVREALLARAGTPAGCVHMTDVTSALSAYFLVGPLATEVLNRVTSLDVRRDRFMQRSCAPCDLAHVQALVYRDDWGALPAYLLLVGRDVGEYVWTAIEAAGSPLGLTPFGLAAERLLRQADPAGVVSPVS